jgi:hypothetical protein
VSAAIEQDCYNNVEKAIQIAGGAVQYGWQIWETLPGLMIEAEFHAIWVDQEGKFHDVTPKPYGINRILFLPDDTKKYEGRQINNIRMSLSDDPLVTEFIEISNDYFAQTNKGLFASFHGYFLPGKELKRIISRKKELEREIMAKYYS